MRDPLPLSPSISCSASNSELPPRPGLAHFIKEQFWHQNCCTLIAMARSSRKRHGFSVDTATVCILVFGEPKPVIVLPRDGRQWRHRNMPLDQMTAE